MSHKNAAWHGSKLPQFRAVLYKHMYRSLVTLGTQLLLSVRQKILFFSHKSKLCSTLYMYYTLIFTGSEHALGSLQFP